jgi:putative hydrolase of the HAD superfamily
MRNKNFFQDIKIIGFDFDNTLVDEKYSEKKRWQETLKRYSFISPQLDKTFFRIYKQRGSSYKFNVNDTLRELGIDEGITKEIVEKFLSTTSDELLLKGALELIKFLKTKKVIVGIITDGKQSYQEGRIKRAGIYGFMDFIYYGLGKKEQKPGKGLLEDCINRFFLKSPGEFFYVGNDYVNDIVGMSRAGVKTCLITKNKCIPETPNLIIVKNLKELLSIFKKYE